MVSIFSGIYHHIIWSNNEYLIAYSSNQFNLFFNKHFKSSRIYIRISSIFRLYYIFFRYQPIKRGFLGFFIVLVHRYTFTIQNRLLYQKGCSIICSVDYHQKIYYLNIFCFSVEIFIRYEKKVLCGKIYKHGIPLCT